MSHIDTHKAYKDLILSGITAEQAEAHIALLNNSFMTKVKELKEDFASQKVNTIFGSIIIIVLTAGAGMMWNIMVDMQVLKNLSNVKHEKEFDVHKKRIDWMWNGGTKKDLENELLRRGIPLPSKEATNS